MYKLNLEDQVKIMYDTITRKERLSGVHLCERCNAEGKRLFRYTKTEIFCADCIVASIKARERGVQYSIKKESDKK